MRLVFISVMLVLFWGKTFAQKQPKQPVSVIEFSGMVFTEGEDGSPVPLPFTTVAVKGTSRGAYSDYDGYFAFIALAGETVVFSRIGYKSVEIVVPDTLTSNHYKWLQIMTSDDYLLPEVIIFPWPSKEHFKQEFFALDISNEIRQKAQENLAADAMREMRHSTPADGKEAGSIVLRQQATDYVYTGQIKPQNIFSPLAWKKFVDAWRRGDFKKKSE